MKRFITFLALLSPILGCDLDHSPISDRDLGYSRYHERGEIQMTFRLLDTTGIPAAVFHAGESFDMEFVLRNMSGKDQTFHHTGPPVLFAILSADTVLCTSIDGMVFPQVVLAGTVHNGETYRATWRAPNSAGRRPRIISLAPGTYVARAHHGVIFDNYRLPPTNTTPFTVLP